MANVAIPAVCTLLGILAGALVNWLLGKRKNSGSASDTDAGKLWGAAEDIRRELRDQAAEALAREAKCNERVAVLEERIAQMDRRMGRLGASLDDARLRAAEAITEAGMLRKSHDRDMEMIGLLRQEMDAVSHWLQTTGGTKPA